MKQNQKFSISKRIRSFGYAFNGLKVLFKEEHNARIHLLSAAVVIAMGFVYEVSMMEWVFLIFAIGFVFIAEIINTSIENLCDFMTKEKNESIKKIKDLAAAGVLIAATTALCIGLIIFLPKIFNG